MEPTDSREHPLYSRVIRGSPRLHLHPTITAEPADGFGQSLVDAERGLPSEHGTHCIGVHDKRTDKSFHLRAFTEA